LESTVPPAHAATMASRQLNLPAKAELWGKLASGMTTQTTDSQQILERVAFDWNCRAIPTKRVNLL
jgi:hypothetical protein